MAETGGPGPMDPALSTLTLTGVNNGDTSPRIMLTTIGWPEGCRTLRRCASPRGLYGRSTLVYPIFDNFNQERRSNKAQSCPPTLTGRRTLGRAEALHPWVSPRLSPGLRRLTPCHTRRCSHVARTGGRMLGVPGSNREAYVQGGIHPPG